MEITQLGEHSKNHQFWYVGIVWYIRYIVHRSYSVPNYRNLNPALFRWFWKMLTIS